MDFFFTIHNQPLVLILQELVSYNEMVFLVHIMVLNDTLTSPKANFIWRYSNLFQSKTYPQMLQHFQARNNSYWKLSFPSPYVSLPLFSHSLLSLSLCAPNVTITLTNILCSVFAFVLASLVSFNFLRRWIVCVYKASASSQFWSPRLPFCLNPPFSQTT